MNYVVDRQLVVVSISFSLVKMKTAYSILNKS